MEQVIPVANTWDAASVVVVVGAIGTMLISVIGSVSAAVLAWGAKTNSVANGIKTDEVIKKSVEIHTLANSTLSKTEAALNIALERNKGLETLLSSMQQNVILAAENAAKLAVANLAQSSQRSTDNRRADIVAEKIEGNTKEIANNTAPIAEVFKKP